MRPPHPPKFAGHHQNSSLPAQLPAELSRPSVGGGVGEEQNGPPVEAAVANEPSDRVYLIEIDRLFSFTLYR